jgi:hypothetical protein
MREPVMGQGRPYQQRQDRKKARNLKIMAKVALRALAVVLAVRGFCGEGPGGFVSCGLSRLVFGYYSPRESVMFFFFFFFFLVVC